MATKYRIKDGECQGCGACVPACPKEAIGEDPYSINVELCDGCGECADVCPFEAIEAYEYEPPVPPDPHTGNGVSVGVNLSNGEK